MGDITRIQAMIARTRLVSHIVEIATANKAHISNINIWHFVLLSCTFTHGDLHEDIVHYLTFPSILIF